LAAQRAARRALGDAYIVERWGYDWVSRMGANLGANLGNQISPSNSANEQSEEQR